MLQLRAAAGVQPPTPPPSAARFFVLLQPNIGQSDGVEGTNPDRIHSCETVIRFFREGAGDSSS